MGVEEHAYTGTSPGLFVGRLNEDDRLVAYALLKLELDHGDAFTVSRIGQTSYFGAAYTEIRLRRRARRPIEGEVIGGAAGDL